MSSDELTLSDFRPGAVLRLPRLGPVVPAEGHDVVAVFLGACPVGQEPDASAMLRRLGWQRSFVFEATIGWRGEEEEYESTHLFSASSPQDAADSLARLVRAELLRGPMTLEWAQVLAINVGPVSDDGSQTRRGRVFLSWHASTGESLASFVARHLAPTAESSPTPCDGALAASETAAPPATPATTGEPA